jgi:hypothetical protein
LSFGLPGLAMERIQLRMMMGTDFRICGERLYDQQEPGSICRKGTILFERQKDSFRRMLPGSLKPIPLQTLLKA